jgi:hypothetical protein
MKRVGTPSASDQIQLRLFLVARALDTAYKATVPSSCTRANFLPTFPIRLFLTSFNSLKNWSFDRVAPSANFALTAMLAEEMSLLSIDEVYFLCFASSEHEDLGLFDNID